MKDSLKLLPKVGAVLGGLAVLLKNPVAASIFAASLALLGLLAFLGVLILARMFLVQLRNKLDQLEGFDSSFLRLTFGLSSGSNKAKPEIVGSRDLPKRDDV